MKLSLKSFKGLSVRTKSGSVLLLFSFVAVQNLISVNYFKNLIKIDAAVVNAASRQLRYFGIYFSLSIK